MQQQQDSELQRFRFTQWASKETGQWPRRFVYTGLPVLDHRGVPVFYDGKAPQSRVNGQLSFLKVLVLLPGREPENRLSILSSIPAGWARLTGIQ